MCKTKENMNWDKGRYHLQAACIPLNNIMLITRVRCNHLVSIVHVRWKHFAFVAVFRENMLMSTGMFLESNHLISTARALWKHLVLATDN